MITSDFLKSIITYNHTTGIFTWNNSQNIAGTNHCGYIRIRINGRAYRAHRLAWLYYYGVMPILEIDHIDRNKCNNAIDNLRLCNRCQNMHNLGLNKNNSSGASGIRFIKGKYEASIKVNNKSIYLGRFLNIEDAIQKREESKSFYHSH